MTQTRPLVQLLNILVPGIGLMWRGQPRLGVSVLLLFALCSHAAISTWLYAPMAWPRSVAWSSLLGAAAAWAAAQWLLGTLPLNGKKPVSPE